MKTDNELIAEFMGYSKLHESWLMTMPNNPNSVVDSRDFKYNASWDCLMPVVKKIRQLAIDLPPNNEHFQAIINNLIDVEIWDCHFEVVEFIKWYNQNRSGSNHKKG